MPPGEGSRREAMGRAAEVVAPSSSIRIDGGCPVAQVNDLSRSLTAFDLISTLVVVVEMSQTLWRLAQMWLESPDPETADSGGHGPAGEHHRGVPARHGPACTG